MRLSIKQKVQNTYNPEVMRDILGQIESMVNLLAGGSIQARGTGSAAPTSGQWAKGDIIWNSSPISGGTAGFICVSGGSPGTWKNWGTIS